MLDALGNISSVLITLITVLGFLALGAFLLFEIITMAVFWMKRSLRGSPGGPSSVTYQNRRWDRAKPGYVDQK